MGREEMILEQKRESEMELTYRKAAQSFPKYIILKDSVPVGVLSFENKGSGHYYHQHFQNPDICRYDLQHEELLVRYSEKWVEDARFMACVNF